MWTACPACCGQHGIRSAGVHPVNTKVPSKSLGLVLFYVPPHVILEPGHHPTEETYSIVEGEATMIFERSRQNLKKGDCVYLPP